MARLAGRFGNAYLRRAESTQNILPAVRYLKEAIEFEPETASPYYHWHTRLDFIHQVGDEAPSPPSTLMRAVLVGGHLPVSQV